MSDLDKATRPDATGRPGRFTVTLDGQWGIGPRLHGGYLLAVCARAAVEEAAGVGGPVAHATPHAVTGTFLRAPVPGPAELGVDVLRRGRTVSQLRVRLDQDGEPCVETAVTLGTPVPADAPVDVTVPAPDLAGFEQCPRSPADGADGRGALPLMDVVDTRLDPATAGFIERRPTGHGRIAGWGELADRTPWTPLGLLIALDLMPPATFDLGLSGWTPTMSLSAHVPGDPAPGPVRLEQVVDLLVGDRLHESCRAWDAEGRLVGIATQVAAVRR